MRSVFHHYLCVLSHRKRAASKSSNGSHKYKGNSKDLKPPDLWIHHERLELKPMDKSPDPNPVMTETPIPRTSQDITPADSGLDSNPHLQQRRNSYRGQSCPRGKNLMLWERDQSEMSPLLPELTCIITLSKLLEFGWQTGKVHFGSLTKKTVGFFRQEMC